MERDAGQPIPKSRKKVNRSSGLAPAINVSDAGTARCRARLENLRCIQVTRLELALAVGTSREDNIRIELAESVGRENTIRKQHARALEEVGPKMGV